LRVVNTDKGSLVDVINKWHNETKLDKNLWTIWTVQLF
jgi:hypothetical protein